MGDTRASLRILALSNLYPPFHLGGYELGCRDVVEGLTDAGHAVTVLTSRHGLEGPRVEGRVMRGLAYWPDRPAGSWGALARLEWENRRRLAVLLTDFRPDALLVFSLYGISQGLLLSAQRRGVPVAYLFSAEWLEPGYRGDPWMERWAGVPADPGRARIKAALRRRLDPLLPTGLEPPDLRHACFTSARLRALYTGKGFPVAGAPVIHWGVDPARFAPPPPAACGAAIRLLFAGRIAPEKGLHTAVEALGLLARVGGAESIRLDVAGPVQDAAYLATLRERTAALRIADRVRFLGVLPREEMPRLYREHDVLVFPSIWEEPFSIGLLEAMASGLAVIGTPAGGSAEILADGKNSLTFPPGDAAALADQLGRLADPELRRSLGAAARRTVAERFTLEAMVGRIQAFLGEAVRHRAAARSGG